MIIAYPVPMGAVHGLKYVPGEIRERVLGPFLSGEVAVPVLIVSVILAVLTLLL